MGLRDLIFKSESEEKEKLPVQGLTSTSSAKGEYFFKKNPF